MTEVLKEGVTCIECGILIPRKGYDTDSSYEKRKFCSNSCSAKYNNKLREKKKYYCLNCNKELSRKKKYCDNQCQADYEYKEYIKRWKSGEESGLSGRFGISNHIRRYLFEKNDSKCERCGWSEENEFTKSIPLEIEHIDGDYRNNKEENLALLCPNCHSLTSTYKGANKGNGRVGRHLKSLEKIEKAESSVIKLFNNREIKEVISMDTKIS